MHVDAAEPVALPRLICIPSDDVAFARLVATIQIKGEYRSPRELQDRLRRSYPTAVVNRRELSAELWPTWYVFRDTVVSRQHDEEWWSGPACARIAFRGHRVVEANAAMHELLRYAGGDLIGRPLSDVVPIEALEDVEILLRLLREERVTIVSTFVVSTSSGGRKDVQHRTVVREDGAVESVLREVTLARANP